MTQSLLVPVEGLMQVIDEPHAGPFALLDEGGAEGPAVSVNLSIDNDGRRVCFRLAEYPPQNNRARHILADLAGMHIVITGPAIFLGLDPDVITDLMERP